MKTIIVYDMNEIFEMVSSIAEDSLFDDYDEIVDQLCAVLKGWA